MKRDCETVRQFRLPIQVLVYCYRRAASGIEYLMLRRTAKYGGFWQGVTGAPEGKECLLEASMRELHEETQLTPVYLQQVDFGYSFPVEEEWKWAYHPSVERIEEFVFVAEVALGAEPLLSFEHDAYEWTNFEQALTLLKWPNNRAALEFCNGSLIR